MPSTSAPFGLEPVRHLAGGTIRYFELNGGIASAYNTSLYTGTLVQFTGGVVNASSATTQTNLGVFAGCSYVDSAGNQQTSAYWPAGTVATQIVAWVWNDPMIIYRVQSAGVATLTNRGNEADGAVISGGSTLSGLSTMVIATTMAGAGASGQLKILDKWNSPRNDWGDTYTILEVQINENQMANNVNAVA